MVGPKFNRPVYLWSTEQAKGFECYRKIQGQILVTLLGVCMFSKKSHKFCEPQFPWLKNEDKNSSFSELSGGLRDVWGT